MVRGSVVMPSGTGKTKRMLVIAKPDKAKEALEAGADYAGSDEYIKKIAEENWFEFDTLVATPDMMVQVGKIGRVLGPRGLMPNPKVGTVTADVGKAVKRAQGRSRRVPRREGGHHPDPDRQGVVQAGGARGEPQALLDILDEAQAGDGEGHVHADGHHLDHARTRRQGRHLAVRGPEAKE